MASKTILGISPGTRVIGLAVIIKGELVEWRVKSFKDTWSTDKKSVILTVIERLIAHYDVSELALKKVDPLKSSRELDLLIRSIEKMTEKKRIRLTQFSLSQLEFDQRSGKRDGKKQLTEKLVEKHPELRKEYLRERNNRTEYYTKMFEAIAIAERCRES